MPKPGNSIVDTFDFEPSNRAFDAIIAKPEKEEVQERPRCTLIRIGPLCLNVPNGDTLLTGLKNLISSCTRTANRIDSKLPTPIGSVALLVEQRRSSCCYYENIGGHTGILELRLAAHRLRK